MRRIHRWYFAALFYAGCTACGVASDPAPGAAPGAASAENTPRPNVLFIVIDTLRADRLGAYGHGRSTSPNLDALAADGMLVPRALSTAPWTTPSIAALMASRYPTSLGIESEKARLADEALLLAEVLQAAGYATGAAVSHSFCSSTWGFDQGFEGFDETNVQGHAALTTSGVTARGKSFLDEVAEQQAPWMLWLHYFDPHCAYVEDERFPFGGRGEYDGRVKSGELYRVILREWRKYKDADWRELERLYDSEIARTDAGIGELLTHLDELGLADDTLVVVTADHGEEFHDHGGVGHAKTLYSEVLHVPLILRFPPAFPRFSAGQPAAPEHWVSLVDVAPTVLDVAGLEIPPAFAGQSILGASPRPVFATTHRAKGQRAIIDGDLKLIHWVTPDRFALYDLAADPGEQTDLSTLPEHAQDLARLQKALAEHAARVRENALLAPSVDEQSTDTKHLMDLGYSGVEDDE